VAELVLVRPMRALPFFVGLLAFVPLLAAAPEPQGQPDYVRGAEGWFYACWMYPNSRAVHGRLRSKDKELMGKRNGETIKTGFGTLVWRGNYLPQKKAEKSTGWLFVESFTGPPFIRDSYDPKTNTLRH
jgi:hypothetical protein